MYFNDKTEAKIRKISKQMEEAEGKAELVRNEKTVCQCCKKPVDNSKSKYGFYNKSYFLEGGDFICEVCYFIKIILKNAGLMIWLTVTLAILDVMERIISNITKIPYKLICVTGNIVNFIHRRIDAFEDEYRDAGNYSDMKRCSLKKWCYEKKVSWWLYKRVSYLWSVRASLFDQYYQNLLYKDWRDSFEYKYLL